MIDTIAFTGHRDCHTAHAELLAIWKAHPRAKWVHGGAKGFDAQVEAFAKEHGIETQIFRPDYRWDYPKVAPLARDRRMVDRAQLVVACYDGRRKGGTFYTVNYAKERGVPIVYVKAIPLEILQGA